MAYGNPTETAAASMRVDWNRESFNFNEGALDLPYRSPPKHCMWMF
jgi:hypothetical protein